MMYAARPLTSWSVRAALPPLAGIAIDFGSPGCGVRPLGMTSIRKLGSSGLGTPVSLSSGLSTAAIPPSRLVPWHAAEFWAERVAALAEWHGSAALAEREGEEDLYAT